MNFDDVFMKIYPMKAKGVKPKDVPWDDPNYIWQRKYDGDRRFLWITEKKNYNTSRNTSKETGLPTDKTDNTPHFRDLQLPELAGTVLDGEFDHPLGMDEGIRRIMGCLPELAVERQKELGWIEYYVYDIIFYKGEYLGNKTLRERQEILKEVFKNWKLNLNPHIHLVESYPGGNRDFLEKKMEEILNLPFGEGMIAKNLNSKLRISEDKCQVCEKKDWVKVKKGYNGDFVIMGFEPAERDYDGKTDLDKWPHWEKDGKIVDISKAIIPNTWDEYGYEPVTKYHAMNWIGAIIYGDYQNGVLTKVGTVSSGLTEELRAEISMFKERYIGKVIELDAFERVEKTRALKQPRFKKFRDDKLPEECIYENQKG